MGSNTLPIGNANTCAFSAAVFSAPDYTQPQTASTLAYKSSQVITPTSSTFISSTQNAKFLIANNINFYGTYGLSANSGFNFMQQGKLSNYNLSNTGYQWVDSLICAMWLQRSIQSNLLNLFVQTPQVVNDPTGTQLIKTTIEYALNQAITNGFLAVGVDLSPYAATLKNTYNLDYRTVSAKGYAIVPSVSTPKSRASRGVRCSCMADSLC